MADLRDPKQPARKHKVIHWNPEDEEGQPGKTSTAKAYLGGALGALLVAVILGSGYFLFVYQAPDEIGQSSSNEELEGSSLNRAFESVSRAQGVRDNIERKLEAATQMPITGNEVLRQMLINIQKEKIDADDYMRRSSYARAIAQYNRVDGLIEEFTSEVENKQNAQSLYNNFLVKSSALERGKHLNPEDFQTAFFAASEGKNFLDTGSFTPALQRLEEAESKLDAVETSINNFIRSNAALGQRFISQGKSSEAIEAFTRVLEIDPANEEAVRLLERARVADRAFLALQAGETSEDGGDLESALTSFQEAFSIDSGSAKAQSGVARVRRKIQERDFTNFFAAAKSAEESLRFEDAIENYRAALEIFPSRSDIETAIEKARAAKRQNDIVTRITRAYDHERAYEWAQARDLYQELVNMEPDLQEAKDGLLRTGRMIRSILRYEKLLEVAKGEAQSAEFQLAIRTFDQAMQSKPTYVQLDDEAERLRKFLQLQSQPVPVQITSDGTTWVSIQGPSTLKPERFEERTVNLLPGKYFVIGRRKGYQDVRFGLQIRGGMAQTPLTVICETRNNY